MKVANELPNDETFSHLGSSALYLITTLPEEERTQEQTNESCKITPQYANKYIKVFHEFKDRNTSFDLGLNALYLIATLPEDERTKEHTTSQKYGTNNHEY